MVDKRHLSALASTLILALSCAESSTARPVMIEAPTVVLTPSWSLAPPMLARLGLYDIGLASADELGRVYLADRGGVIVVVLDTQGRYVRTLGGWGHGPGEFESISSVDVAGEVVSILDGRLGRLERYDTSGEYVGTTAVRGSTGASIIGLAARGRTWAVGSVNTNARDGESIVQILDVDSAGSVAAVTDSIRSTNRITSAGNFHAIDPSALRDHYKSNGGRLAVARIPHIRPADSAAFDTLIVRVWSSALDLVWAAKVPFEWHTIAPEERRREHTRILANATTTSPAEVERALPFNGPQPPVTDLVLGADGSVWLRGPSIGRPQVEWLVWNSTGQLRGRIELPDSISVIGATSEVVWTGQRFEDGTVALVAFTVGIQGS